MKNAELGKFEVGDKVIVCGEFITEYDRRKSALKIPVEIPFRNPKFGIICGATHKHTGKYKHASFDPEGGYMDDAPYLSVEKTFTVWLVRLGLLNSPICCLSSQLKIYNMEFKLPIKYYSHK
jgi:hypothetical protein